MVERVEKAIVLLAEIINDRGVPKNIRVYSEEAQNILRDQARDIEVKIDSVMQIMDEMTNDPNLETFTRTQIWGVVSLLESADAQNL